MMNMIFLKSPTGSKWDKWQICSLVEVRACEHKNFLPLNYHLIIALTGGRTLFYLCIAIYLYGDLAIYAAAVPKTLRDIAW